MVAELLVMVSYFYYPGNRCHSALSWKIEQTSGSDGPEFVPGWVWVSIPKLKPYAFPRRAWERDNVLLITYDYFLLRSNFLINNLNQTAVL